MSNWYPGANRWENKGSYKVKYKLDSNGKCTDILMARSGLSDKEADNDHIHIYRVGETAQGTTFRDDQGKLENLSDYDIKQILSGARPLF
ncbi:hypothetical protein [Oscillatoria salina]|uniref:hypothetical protein n=1 Tax=Oscillatoria salina TaxID=331517 RepID=UPI0013B93CAA|nr:hypothetical protein [Oscillatoria salina]MBZ8180668.1 hypothetical protein [Oscillatoria salina IIICB1]NET87392.1 hypothetical protein [Kamptonema sp. SIO1D9]